MFGIIRSSALLAAVFTTMSGCPTTTTFTPYEPLVGIWQKQPNGEIFHEFTEDGHFNVGFQIGQWYNEWLYRVDITETPFKFDYKSANPLSSWDSPGYEKYIFEVDGDTLRMGWDDERPSSFADVPLGHTETYRRVQ